MEAQGIAPVFVKLKVVPLGLFIVWLGINNFQYAIKTAKPAGNIWLQIYQYLVMVARLFFGTDGHRGIVDPQGMGHKGGVLKAPEFFIQLLGHGIVWHQAEHLLIHVERFLN